MVIESAHIVHLSLTNARRVYTPIIKMAWIGKKPEFAAKRGTHLVRALRAEPAVPPLSRPRNKRDGIARYSGHKRRARASRVEPWSISMLHP